MHGDSNSLNSSPDYVNLDWSEIIQAGGNSPLDVSSDCIQYPEVVQTTALAKPDEDVLSQFLRRRTRLLWRAYDQCARELRDDSAGLSVGERSRIVATLAKAARDLASVDRSGDQKSSQTRVNAGVIVLPGKDAPDRWSGRAQASGREGAPGKVQAVDLDQVRRQLRQAEDALPGPQMQAPKRKRGRPRMYERVPVGKQRGEG